MLVVRMLVMPLLVVPMLVVPMLEWVRVQRRLEQQLRATVATKRVIVSCGGWCERVLSIRQA
jgi:hypothetical protein